MQSKPSCLETSLEDLHPLSQKQIPLWRWRLKKQLNKSASLHIKYDLTLVPTPVIVIGLLVTLSWLGGRVLVVLAGSSNSYSDEEGKESKCEELHLRRSEMVDSRNIFLAA